jgi:hypothetical protein
MTLQAVGVSQFSSLCTTRLPRVLHLELISHFIFNHGIFNLTIVVHGMRLTSTPAGTLPASSYLVIHYYFIIISLLP